MEKVATKECKYMNLPNAPPESSNLAFRDIVTTVVLYRNYIINC